VLPAALGAGVVTYFGIRALVVIGSLVGLSESGQYFVTQLTASVAQPVAFVLAGAKVAPERHFGVAVVLTVFYAIVSTTILAVAPASQASTAGTWVIGGASILGLVAAIVASYGIHARETVSPGSQGEGSV
jgi:hypothetical protein